MNSIKLFQHQNPISLFIFILAFIYFYCLNEVHRLKYTYTTFLSSIFYLRVFMIEKLDGFVLFLYQWLIRVMNPILSWRMMMMVAKQMTLKWTRLIVGVVLPVVRTMSFLMMMMMHFCIPFLLKYGHRVTGNYKCSMNDMISLWVFYLPGFMLLADPSSNLNVSVYCSLHIFILKRQGWILSFTLFKC